MVGFVQKYADGANFISPENEIFEGSLIQLKESRNSMKNHEITCFYGEKGPTTNNEYGTPKP